MAKFIAEVEVEAEQLWEHIKVFLERHPNATVTINPKGPTKPIHIGTPTPDTPGSPPHGPK